MHDLITIHFKDSRQHDLNIKIPGGFCIAAPYNDFWTVTDLDGKQWALNWTVVSYMELLSSIPD